MANERECRATGEVYRAKTGYVLGWDTAYDEDDRKSRQSAWQDVRSAQSEDRRKCLLVPFGDIWWHLVSLV